MQYSIMRMHLPSSLPSAINPSNRFNNTLSFCTLLVRRLINPSGSSHPPTPPPIVPVPEPAPPVGFRLPRCDGILITFGQ